MTFDYIIIGGGAAGLSAAAALSSFGRVALLEQESAVGYHATGRSAAIFADGYGDEIVQQLSAASRPIFEAPPFDTDGVPLLTPRGLLYLVMRDRSLPVVDDDYGGFSALSVAEACALVPVLRAEAIERAFYDPNAADINVHGLLMGWQKQIRGNGGSIFRDCLFDGAQRRDGIWTLATGTDVLSAPLLINAAGAWADRVGAMLGARPLGLQPMRRTAATIAVSDDHAPRTWPMVIDTDESVYFKPESPGLMLSLAEETLCEPGDAAPEEIDVATAVFRFEKLADIAVRTIASSWAGLRTVTSDRRPIVGYDADVDGLFWLAGQGGFGIQTAFALAQLSVDIITGQSGHDVAHMATVLSPTRFVD